MKETGVDYGLKIIIDYILDYHQKNIQKVAANLLLGIDILRYPIGNRFVYMS